jgi:hypothetical protein
MHGVQVRVGTASDSDRLLYVAPTQVVTSGPAGSANDSYGQDEPSNLKDSEYHESTSLLTPAH